MNKSTTLTAALAALILTGSAFAYNPQQVAPQPATAPAKLVPSKIVNPRVPMTFKRGVLELEFSLDAAGQPQQVRVLSNVDTAVKEHVVKAFKQWKFEGASREPDAAAQRFILPLEIIPEV